MVVLKNAKSIMFFLIIAITLLYFPVKSLIMYYNMPKYDKQAITYMKEVKKSLKFFDIDIDSDIREPQFFNNCKIVCDIVIPEQNSSFIMQVITDTFNDTVDLQKYDLVNNSEERICMFIYSTQTKQSSWICKVILEFNDNHYIPVDIDTNLNPKMTNLTFSDMVLTKGFENVSVATIYGGSTYDDFNKNITPFIDELKALRTLTFTNSSVDLACIKELQNVEYLQIDGGEIINFSLLNDVKTLKEIRLKPDYISTEEIKAVKQFQQENDWCKIEFEN